MRFLFAALALAVLASACSGDGSKGTPTVLGTPTLGPPATAGMILERTPQPTLAPVPFDGPASHDYKSGDTITDRSGILLVDPVRLTMQVWTMPEPYVARPISHDGRWVFWARPNSDRTTIVPQQVLDTRNGTSRAIVLGSELVHAVGVSDSGTYFVGYTDTKVALFETATLRPLAVVERPLSYTVDSGEGDFSADETMAAVAFRRGDARFMAVLGVDGHTTGLIGGSWPYRWSHLGHKLAMTSTPVTVLRDLDAGTTSLIPAVGFNPRWSPDDRYFAIANDQFTGGARIFSTSPPYEEVLRTVGNANCLADYWYADGSMRYDYELEVTVPGGRVQPAPPYAPPAVLLDYDANLQEAWAQKDGVVIMRFKTGPNFMWAYFYDDSGVLTMTSDGRGLELLGYGGKGLCDAQLPAPAVQLPPFGP